MIQNSNLSENVSFGDEKLLKHQEEGTPILWQKIILRPGISKINFFANTENLRKIMFFISVWRITWRCHFCL